MSGEYPKVIQTGGITVTVTDADDEARWKAAVPAAQLPPPVVSAPEPEPEPEQAAPVAAEPEAPKAPAPKQARKPKAPRAPKAPKKK